MNFECVLILILLFTSPSIFSRHNTIPNGNKNINFLYLIYPTPPLGQDMTQGQSFLSRV